MAFRMHGLKSWLRSSSEKRYDPASHRSLRLLQNLLDSNFLNVYLILKKYTYIYILVHIINENIGAPSHKIVCRRIIFTGRLNEIKFI